MSHEDKAALVKSMTTGQLIAELTSLVFADESEIDYDFVRLAKKELESRDTKDEEDEC